MSHPIPETLIAQLSEFISAKTGLYFPKERWSELRRAVRSITRDLSEKHKTEYDPESCVRMLLSDQPDEKNTDILISHLTIGETYFFRDRHLFHVLEKNILPELIRMRRNKEKSLRFWSAACCTGEEAYSLAILIDQLLPEWQEWDIMILATDLNEAFLQKARKGIYKEWSFRDTPESVKEKYFKKKDEKHSEISPRLKNMVTFSQLNLSENNYPSKQNNTYDMDMILCRNVLMYFDPELRKQIVHRLTRSLSKDGWMILSPGDAIYARHPALYPFRFPQIILYKKKNSMEGSLSPRRQQNAELTKQIKEKPVPSLNSEMIRQAAPKAEKGKPVPDKSEPSDSKKNKKEPASKGETQPVSDIIAGDAIQMLYQKAMRLANQGDLAAAEKCCKDLIDSEKLHAGSHYLLATICQEQGRLRESARSLKHALFLDPKFVLAHFALGNLMRRERRDADAKKHFSNAMSLLISMDNEAVLPCSEGMTAGRLKAVIQEILKKYE